MNVMHAVPVWRRAVAGALQGMVFVAAGLVAASLLLGNKFPLWPDSVCVVLASGVVFAIGRALTGRLAGACFGALLGLYLGAVVAQKVPYGYASLHELPDSPGKVLEIAGPTLDGKEFDVKQYRGKVVLVDFWATWCPPCVAELPHIRQAYDRYHEDGFEVVGVSLDVSRAKLAEFVKEHGLPWPQVFFDRARQADGNNPLARRYGINAIPATFLLDRRGRVVAENLRGSALEQVIPLVLAHPDSEEPFQVVHVPVARYALWLVGLLGGAFAGALLQRRFMALPAGQRPPAPPAPEEPRP
jgi:thiol-disulfide isomerase/thioredoxin